MPKVIAIDLTLRLEGDLALTPALRRVAEALALGASDREIATMLGKSRHTVANQVHHLIEQFHADSRYHLIAMLWGATKNSWKFNDVTSVRR